MKNIKEYSNEILAEAIALNFYGKRKRDTRLECAEDIINSLDLLGQIEPSNLVYWLENNQPTATKTRAQSKPAANTMVDGHEAPPPLPAIRESKAYIVTGVQNNTAIHAECLAELERLARLLKAELVFLPVYYNKNAFSPAVEEEAETFAPEVASRMVFEDSELFGGSVILRPSAATLPTAKLPINAAAALNCGEAVTVVPNTKQQLRTLPSAPAQGIKEAWTTGVVTKQNYTRSRAGAEAAHDHIFGGVLVFESKAGAVFTRNLTFSRGVIFDAATIRPFEGYAVLGDLHCEMKDQAAWDLTIEMMRKLQPKAIAVHDILHFSTRSHHQRNDGKHLYLTKNASVVDDLLRVIEDLNQLAEIAPIYVVQSNHNSALDNWLHDVSYSPKRDPHQAKIYYLLSYLVADALDHGEDTTALQVAFENLDQFDNFPKLSSQVRFGSMDTAELWNGTDVACHGHKGQNGSAGNTNLFSKWKLPMVTGHTHSPAIIGQVLTVGVTAKLDQGYNKGGASSWRQSHGLIMPNGTRQILPLFGL